MKNKTLLWIALIGSSFPAMAAAEPSGSPQTTRPRQDRQDRMVCRREVALGTIMPRVVCKTAAQREREARESVATRERVNQGGGGRALGEDVH
jgi:hypothetical protein